MGRPLLRQGGVGSLTVLFHWLFAMTFVVLLASSFGMALGMVPSSFLGGNGITVPGVAITMLAATFVGMGWAWFAETQAMRRTDRNPSVADIRKALREQGWTEYDTPEV